MLKAGMNDESKSSGVNLMAVLEKDKGLRFYVNRTEIKLDNAYIHASCLVVFRKMWFIVHSYM